MINLGKALIILRNQQKFSPSIHTNSNLHKFIKKNYLSTSQNKSKKSSDKIDLRSEFQDMINETKISEEEVQNTNKEEQIKLKHSMDQAKKDFDAKQENLKNEWEKNRHSNAEEDKDSEIKINHIKKKFTSAFFFNKEKPQGKEEQGGKNSNDKNDEEEKNSESLEPSKFSKFVSGFAKVWRETFPGEENVELLLEKRKLEAQILKSKIKEPTEEEIQQIEESIPEWKRGAVVFVMDQPAEETVSFFDVAKRNLKSHVKNLKIYKEAQESLQNSELSLLVEDLKTSYTNVRENLKESQNPFFVVSRDLIDRVNFKSPSSLATQVMRKHDPNFELVLFEKEVDAIFKQLMMAYVKDDLDTVRLVAGDMALAVLTNDIKSRRERGIENKYKELLYIDHAQYHSANVVDEDTCVLRFRISTQEINCKISRKDGKVVEGNIDLIENIQYMIDITRNPTPVVEEVGHPYLVVSLERVGVMRQVV